MANKGIKSLYGLQMINATFSFSGSATVAIMILRSNSKLDSPFRRLIFGLSISDLFQSLALMIGPIVTDSNISQSQYANEVKLWNIGNRASCDFQGFLIMFGASMCASYTLSLCIFYLQAVKHSKTNEEFAKGVEWKLHGIGILYAFVSSVIYLTCGFYNNFPDGSMCFVVEKPVGCHASSSTSNNSSNSNSPTGSVECERGAGAQTLILYLTFIPVMFICMGIMHALGSLYLFVKADGDRQQRLFWSGLKSSSSSSVRMSISSRLSSRLSGLYGSARSSARDSVKIMRRSTLRSSDATARISKTREDEEDKAIEKVAFKINLEAQSQLHSSHMSVNVESPQNYASSRRASVIVREPGQYVTRAEKRAKARQRQTLTQAILYVGAYMFAYTLPLLAYFVWFRRGKDPPLAFTIILHAVFPLQGLLNIFIYTRPKAITLRQRYPNFSWYQAFWEVVKAGGEIPLQYQRRKRSSRGS